MNQRWQNLIALALLTLLAFRCVSSNVNVLMPEAITGYVDFTHSVPNHKRPMPVKVSPL